MLKKEFSKFGNVEKIFISREEQFAKVYISDEQSIKQAVQKLNGKKGWTVLFDLEERGHKRTSNFNQSFNSPKPAVVDDDMMSLGNNSYQDDMEEGSFLGDDYVDIHGRPVEVLEGENGKLYVNLEDVRRAGFNIFDKESFENAVITRDIELRQFYNYMLNKGKQYVIKLQKNFNKDEVLSTFESVKAALLGNTNETATNNSFGRSRIVSRDAQSKNFVITRNTAPETSVAGSSKSSDVPTQNGFQSFSPKPPNKNEDYRRRRFKSQDRRRQSRNEGNFNTPPSNLNPPQFPPKNRQQNHTEDKNDVEEEWGSSETPTAPAVVLDSVKLNVGSTYKVIVTNVRPDKGSVFYAQLVDNQSLIKQIVDQVNARDSKNKEIKNPSESMFCVAYDNTLWYRGRICSVGANQTSIELIDFGKRILSSTPVKELSSESSKWPAQSVRMTLSLDSSNTRTSVEVDEELEIVVKKNYSTDTYLVQINGNEREEEPTKEDCFTKIPPSDAQLKNDESVMIIGFNDTHLTLRNKTTADICKKINNYLTTFEKNPISNPQVGQIVLCAKDGLEGMHRAVIKNIKGNVADVEYLDYSGSEPALLKTLRNVDATLASELRAKVDSPSFPILSKITEKSATLLVNMILSKKKLKVVLSGGKFDLQYTEGEEINLLSKKIEEVEGLKKGEELLTFVEVPKPKPQPTIEDPPKKEVHFVAEKVETTKKSEDYKPVSMDDMQYTKVTLGLDMYFCYSCTGSGVTLISISEENMEWLEKIEIKDLEDLEPYAPSFIPSEMCLAKHNNTWYRAANLTQGAIEDTYQVLFVDYGNIETVHKDSVCRFPQKYASVPILGIMTYFIGIPHNEKVHNRLKELVEDAGVLEVNIKNDINEDFQYGIEIPSVYEILKQENLI